VRIGIRRADRSIRDGILYRPKITTVVLVLSSPWENFVCPRQAEYLVEIAENLTDESLGAGISPAWQSRRRRDANDHREGDLGLSAARRVNLREH
jgi:hypothetical protein